MTKFLYKENNLTTRRITVVDNVCVAFEIASNYHFKKLIPCNSMKYFISWTGPDRIMLEMIKENDLIFYK